jgi:hypothetical protein
MVNMEYAQIKNYKARFAITEKDTGSLLGMEETLEGVNAFIKKWRIAGRVDVMDRTTNYFVTEGIQ